MVRDESVIGAIGVLIVATRGQAGPGEVRIRVRGGSETFLAWSAGPLPRGTTVLVTDSPGPRVLDVQEWDDSLGEAPSIPGLPHISRSGE